MLALAHAHMLCTRACGDRYPYPFKERLLDPELRAACASVSPRTAAACDVDGGVDIPTDIIVDLSIRAVARLSSTALWLPHAPSNMQQRQPGRLDRWVDEWRAGGWVG